MSGAYSPKNCSSPVRCVLSISPAFWKLFFNLFQVLRNKAIARAKSAYPSLAISSCKSFCISAIVFFAKVPASAAEASRCLLAASI